MNFLIIRTIVAFLGISAATYFDIFNRKNVPVSIPYFMIGVGLLLNLLSLNLHFIILNTSVAIIILAAGYLVYKSGQLGGADVLVFVGIALLLPSPPLSLLQPISAPFYPYVLSLFVVSGMFSIIGMATFHLPKIVKDLAMRRISVQPSSLLSSVLIFLCYFVLLYYFSASGILSLLQMSFLILLVSLASFLLLFKEHISDSMIELVPLSKIEEEDVLAIDKMSRDVVRKFRLEKVVTKDQIRRMRKMRRKRFPVFKGMPPFLPYIFLAFLTTLIFGDPLLLLIS